MTIKEVITNEKNVLMFKQILTYQKEYMENSDKNMHADIAA